MISASKVCKCFMHNCKRLAELSVSCCKELWKDLCCSTRKKDLASYADLLSYAKKGFGGSVL
jgi:hypothetical protein